MKGEGRSTNRHQTRDRGGMICLRGLNASALGGNVVGRRIRAAACKLMRLRLHLLRLHLHLLHLHLRRGLNVHARWRRALHDNDIAGAALVVAAERKAAAANGDDQQNRQNDEENDADDDDGEQPGGERRRSCRRAGVARARAGDDDRTRVRGLHAAAGRRVARAIRARRRRHPLARRLRRADRAGCVAATALARVATRRTQRSPAICRARRVVVREEGELRGG